MCAKLEPTMLTYQLVWLQIKGAVVLLISDFFWAIMLDLGVEFQMRILIKCHMSQCEYNSDLYL